MRDERSKDAQRQIDDKRGSQANITDQRIAQVVLDGENELIAHAKRVARCLELPKQQLECQHFTVKRSRF